MLLSKWRHISGTLMAPNYGSKNISPNDPRQGNIRQLTAALESVLCLFASVPNDQERLEKLAELVKRGAQFGYLLCTQPTEWEVDWEAPSRRQITELVVFPALMQLADDQGRLQSSPHRFGEMAQTVTMA